MRLSKEEQVKSDIRTSLSVIRFIVQEKKAAFGSKNARLIDEHILRILKYTDKLSEVTGKEENKI